MDFLFFSLKGKCFSLALIKLGIQILKVLISLVKILLMKKNFSIRLISNNEIEKVTDWARLEGFAPGFDDISIYKNTDKQGLWVDVLMINLLALSLVLNITLRMDL